LVVEEPNRGRVEFNGMQGRYRAPEGSVGTYFMTLAVSDGQDEVDVEVRVRVSEARGLGSCSTGPLGAGFALGLMGLAAIRRRR
jgi:uncharacterized protein (TIGR03382 family)